MVKPGKKGPYKAVIADNRAPFRHVILHNFPDLREQGRILLSVCVTANPRQRGPAMGRMFSMSKRPEKERHNGCRTDEWKEPLHHRNEALSPQFVCKDVNVSLLPLGSQSSVNGSQHAVLGDRP